MRVAPEHYVSFVRSLMSLPNVDGICVTIPHKVGIVGIGDIATREALTTGAANTIFRDKQGRIVADLIDSEGFVRALDNTAGAGGFDYRRSSALVVGCGGVGSAIAVSLAGRSILRLGLLDLDANVVDRLALSLVTHYPAIEISTQDTDESKFDLLVNGTPLGMNPGDVLPVDVALARDTAISAECGVKTEMSELLRAAQAHGLRIQKGEHMLFEQAPLSMDRFGWPGSAADQFRALGVL